MAAGVAREGGAGLRLKQFLGRYFYFCASLVMAGVSLWGFRHTVDVRLLHAEPPRPMLLWFHAAVFSAWIVLFVAQSALVRVRKVRVDPVPSGSRQCAPFPCAPRPSMKPDISTLFKPDILILQRHHLFVSDLLSNFPVVSIR